MGCGASAQPAQEPATARQGPQADPGPSQLPSAADPGPPQPPTPVLPPEEDKEEARSIASGDGSEKKKEEEEEEEDDDDEVRELKQMPPRPRARQILASGALRLLSATWLVSQGEGYILQRMQDLPEDAFLSPKCAAELLDKEYGVVVISYGWLGKTHPDPTGFHMHTVQRYLKKHRNIADSCFVAPRLEDYGVFWDFASLPQDQPDGTERSEPEERAFKKGLGAVNLLYGDRKTLVVQLTLMPQELHLAGGSKSSLAPYQTRGWCFFEATVSSLLKEADMLLDLGTGAAALCREQASWREVRDASTATRQPPITPNTMAAELMKRKFTNGRDMRLVSNKYTDFFWEAAENAEELWLANYSGDGWGDAEVVQLAHALPAFAHCRKLFLWGHRALSESGLAVLRARLPKCPALRALYLPRHLRDTAEGQAVVQAAAERGLDLYWL